MTPTLLRFLPAQRAMLATLGRALWLQTKLKFNPPPAGYPPLPGPRLAAQVPARPPELIAAFREHVGSAPASWPPGTVPATLFPQWCFPLMQRALSELPFAPTELLNGGCHLVLRSPIPADEPLDVDVRLTTIDDSPRRVIVTEQVTTGTKSAPNALEVTFFAFHKRRGAPSSEEHPAERERPTVPDDATRIATLPLTRHAGLEFALLTGDFNPIHWLRPAARLAGFKSTILHGFSTMARATEALIAHAAAGDSAALAELTVRFVKPLVLPRQVGVFISGTSLFVGDEPGRDAYMTGTFVLRSGGDGAS